MSNKILMSTPNPPVQTSVHDDDDILQLTWDEILHDDGLAARIPRSSFRWLTFSVCLIGVIGNILAVLTLVRRPMRTLSTYAYLTALCVSNTIKLTSVIIFEIDILIEPNRFNCFIVANAKALASATFALSTWITVGFTVDRYIMICFPFMGKSKCTRRNAIYVIIICVLFSLTYLIPQLLAQKCHSMVQYPYNDTYNGENITYVHNNQSFINVYWISGLSEFGRSKPYRLTVTLSFNCFLIRIIPFLTIFKLNLRLIKTLANTQRRSRQLNPHDEKRNDVTYMLVIVISIYLICIMPSIPFTALFAYDPNRYVEISFHYRIFQYIDEFTKFLIILNSSLQCYLYIFFGKRFRHELTRMFYSACMKRYVPTPKPYTSIEREHFSPEISSPNNDFELVVKGEWSLDQRKDSIVGVDFSFHYARRTNRLSSSSTVPLRSNSNSTESQINSNVLQRLKNRFQQLFSSF